MNLEFVEKIVALIGEYPVSEIQVEQEGRRVCVRRPLTAALFPLMSSEMLPLEEVNEAAAVEPEIAPEKTKLLTATMVGIFHHAEPPLPYAATVTPGQVVGYIESMKLMNDVVVEEGGRVTDVLVEDGAPVDYGQPLFRLAS
jgi:acetyl-CoA carboxylase biotin carboxyl carrier protein